MNEFIIEISKGKYPETYQYIIEKALELTEMKQTMNFGDLINLLIKENLREYKSERGVSAVISELFRRSVIYYRDYDKENNSDGKVNADKVCSALAGAFVKNNGDYAY